jgi:hypothetical protein
MDGKAVNVHTMPDDLLLVSLLIHKGQYPLYDVSVRFANGDTLDLNASTYSIGNMAVELSIQRPIRLSHHSKISLITSSLLDEMVCGFSS